MKYDEIIATRSNKVIYRDGKRCLKVFNEEFSKSDILNEALNHARVEETGLNIPKLLEVSVIEGRWALVTEYIEGKTLSQLMEEDPEHLDLYLERFVDIQIHIHSKTSPLLTKIKDKMKRKISLADLSATTKYDLHTRLDSMPRKNKVCHGDFNPTNVIIRPDGTPFVVDWSHVTQGNAVADVARTYLLFKLHQGELAEKYLRLFCAKRDVPRQLVQGWMPIVAASQSVKALPGEREFLLSWVDVVDY